MDMDMDGAIERANSERMTYEYSSGSRSLRRCLYEGTSSQSWQTLIKQVSGLSFAYFDSDGNPIAAPVTAANLDDIRTVQISMTCEGTDGYGQSFTRTLTTRVACRNLSG